MKKYKASTGRELTKTVVWCAIVIGFVMIILSFVQHNIYAALIGIVLILAVIYSKEVYVSEEGVVTEYITPVSRKKEVWEWSDITDIFCEYSEKNPDKVGIHFTKESLMARRLLFPKGMKDAVIGTALEANPKIHVDDEKKA